MEYGIISKIDQAVLICMGISLMGIGGRFKSRITQSTGKLFLKQF